MTAPKNEYSAHVDIWLEVGGRCLDVAQVGDRSLILRDCYQLSPSQHAKIVVTVDGERRAYQVIIRRGTDRVVEFEHCGPDLHRQGTLF